jgi:ABC-type glycerol-3-phosphate transport system permease component
VTTRALELTAAAQRRRVIALPATALVARHLVLMAFGFVLAFPFIWMLLTSFKAFEETLVSPPTVLPTQWHPENYALAWRAADFPRFLLNSAVISLTSVGGVVLTSVLAGYAFARIRVPGRDILFMVCLGTMMIPHEVTLIPNFVILRGLPCPLPIDTICNPRGGWLDTYTASSVPWWVSAFSIFLLRQFFLTIPNELWEASQLDGATHTGYLWRVVLPLSAPALLTVGLYAFVQSWKSFLWPLIMTSRPDVRPIQVGLSTFALEAGTYYHLLMAASAFTIAPVVLLFVLAQRHFLASIARTGLKG